MYHVQRMYEGIGSTKDASRKSYINKIVHKSYIVNR